MIVRELIEQLLQYDMESRVYLRVGGDGAIHEDLAEGVEVNDGAGESVVVFSE